MVILWYYNGIIIEGISELEWMCYGITFVFFMMHNIKIAKGIVLWLFLFTFFLKVIFAEIISSNNFFSVLKVFFR